MNIDQGAQLREIYGEPKERTILKELSALEQHSKRFLALCPFVVISTDGGDHLDASPRGGAPGFIKVLNDNELIIPDSKGNNRVDSLSNIVETGKFAMLGMIPGVDETLRIRGKAIVSNDPELLAQLDEEQNPPKTCIHVQVETVFLHCAKAFMRSKLWKEEAKIERTELPTMGQMIKDQIGHNDPVETQEQMEKRYQGDI
ncbi:pyridoxamine 5'-phosphate oxidase family protein [Sanyastnella coralliicola]|uniref:pyridoxamine 5'-phosphate oxidase family protein n=1 Tax=Sanyastnella coralliicola TaxID=3069118 RepID=UPI0027B9A9A9|nr:pyridoxamine 5'-phosphate oxidase family protein [Longitalea sp. SCSIO 12813]